MSWAACRTTTQVEDRAYSLMGLFDVNMPMLYGEGKKAFHRLQLEIICTSNDQSIFAWEYMMAEDDRIGSILADDPSNFVDCSDLELMGRDGFIKNFSQNRLRSTQTTLMYSPSRIAVSKSGCPSIAIVTPIPSAERTFRAGVPLGAQCALIWSCGIPITIGIRSRGIMTLGVPLQSSVKCTSDIKTHRTTQSHSISMKCNHREWIHPRVHRECICLPLPRGHRKHVHAH